MKLSAAERETVIQWSDADDGTAHICTCQRRMMRKLAKHPAARLVERHADEEGNLTGEEWEVPVSRIRISSGKRRQMSEAQREAARRRMREAQRQATMMRTMKQVPTGLAG